MAMCFFWTDAALTIKVKSFQRKSETFLLQKLLYAAAGRCGKPWCHYKHMLNNNVVVKVCAQTVNGEPVSPWKIFLLAKLRWHLLTLNFFPADLARRLLTCKFFHLQIWHGTFQGCQMHRKTKMIKPKFKSKLKSSKQPWNPLRPKPKYHIPSKTSKFCWKTTKGVKITRNKLEMHCNPTVPP